MSPVLLDSIVGIVILLSAVFAFFRGFVKEALTIVNLAAASGAAWFAGPQLRPFFNKQLGVNVVEKGIQPKPEDIEKIWGVVPPEIMAAFLSYASCFFGAFLILTLAGLYIAGTVKALGLGPIDKTLGVGFGAVRGFLLVFLVYLPFGYFMQPDKNPNAYPDWAKNSVSVAVLQDVYEWGDAYLKAEKEEGSGTNDPDSLKSRMKRMADHMDQKEPATGNPEQDLLTDSERIAAP